MLKYMVGRIKNPAAPKKRLRVTNTRPNSLEIGILVFLYLKERKILLSSFKSKGSRKFII